MNSVNDIIRALLEIAGLVISLAVLAVILQSQGTVPLVNASSQGFSNVLKTAMGQVG